METLPEQAATLYIDGHVRVYNGYQTQLPSTQLLKYVR
jgi:hypothetical protein